MQAAKTIGSLALAVAALSGSMAAQAASETLTYTSAGFTSAYDAGSSAGNVGVGSYFTATLTLNAPLGNNFNGSASNDVTSLVFTTVNGGNTNTLTLGANNAQGSYFDFTTNSSGAITGWNFTAGLVSNGATQLPVASDVLFHSCSNDNCASGSYNGQGYGVTGDWYDYLPSTSGAADGCTYKTPTSCGSGSGAVGSWVAAPELNASNAGTGLTLLFGGLTVLLGRRRGASAAAV